MKKITITQKEKRILIVWFLFATVALLINTNNIEGKLSSKQEPVQNLLMTEYKDGIWPFRMFESYDFHTFDYSKLPQQSTYTHPPQNTYKSDGSRGGDITEDLINTMNTPSEDASYKHTITQSYADLIEHKGTHFYGLLNSFGIEEFIAYSLLILCIIFIPKIW